MSAPLGICPGCGGRTPLNRITGNVRAHDLILAGGVARCSGSGEAPKDGKGTCPLCAQPAKLNRNGLLKRHDGRAVGDEFWCAGRGLAPKAGASL